MSQSNNQRYLLPLETHAGRDSINILPLAEAIEWQFNEYLKDRRYERLSKEDFLWFRDKVVRQVEDFCNGKLFVDEQT